MTAVGQDKKHDHRSGTPTRLGVMDLGTRRKGRLVQSLVFVAHLRQDQQVHMLHLCWFIFFHGPLAPILAHLFPP